MKFNDLLNEQEVNELGVLKNVGKRIKAGVQGAVAGYKAGGLRRQGEAHSTRIADNIKAEFEQMVGGGLEPTYKNLIDFLEQLGLNNLESIPNPKQAAAKKPESGTATDPNQRIEPTLEDVEPELNSYEIDRIIKDAVKKNYARIVAAQKGRSFGDQSTASSAPDEPEQKTQTSTDASGTSSATEPPSTKSSGAPKSNVKVDYSIEAFTKAYQVLDPKEREELRKQLDIIDDQDRLASGTNENLEKPRSKYLGIDL